MYRAYNLKVYQYNTYVTVHILGLSMKCNLKIGWLLFYRFLQGKNKHDDNKKQCHYYGLF